MNNLKYQRTLGGLESISAYTIWGLTPLFWNLLAQVSPWLIIANRMLWSCVMMFLLILIYKQLPAIKAIFCDTKGLLTILICSCLIFCNWSLYIWAVSEKLVIEASLGYYINPLMVLLFSKIFLGEEFDLLKKISILIAVSGIAIMVFHYGNFPYVSISLSTTFAIYGLIKKRIKYSPIQTMFMENLFFFIPALLFIFYSPATYTFHLSTQILLALSGVVTGVPLILFAAGVKKVNLSTQGYFQFIAPTIMFFLSKYVLKENINHAQFIGLFFVWAACLVFIISLFVQKKEIVSRHKK